MNFKTERAFVALALVRDERVVRSGRLRGTEARLLLLSTCLVECVAVTRGSEAQTQPWRCRRVFDLAVAKTAIKTGACQFVIEFAVFFFFCGFCFCCF